jgi:hypothetical protein
MIKLGQAQNLKGHHLLQEDTTECPRVPCRSSSGSRPHIPYNGYLKQKHNEWEARGAICHIYHALQTVNSRISTNRVEA